MSERAVREQAKALEQRFARSEANQRAIRLKAYPGAVRTETSFTNFTPTSPSVNGIILSLNIPSGRWVLLATAVYLLAPSVEAQFTLAVTIVDTASGMVVTNPNTDVPETKLYMPQATGVFQQQTATMIGDLVADNAVTVQLWSRCDTATSHTIFNARLRLLPV